MEIQINHKPFEVGAGAPPEEALAKAGVPAEGVAVAVNNRVVARRDWASTQLEEGAKVTVIRAVCGG